MKRSDFGTILTWAERRSILTWLTYTCISTALLIGYGIYEQYSMWSHDTQQPTAMVDQQDLQTRLHEKAALEKELISLRERSAYLERIGQQRSNPHQLIQELLTVLGQGMHLQSVIADTHTIRVAIQAQQAQQVDALLAACAKKPVLQALHLSSLESADGAIQIMLQAQL